MSKKQVKPGKGTAVATETRDFVTVYLHGQLLGFPVLAIHDVLSPQKITPVPLAPAAIKGVLNLRGRIVTAVDLRERLGLPPREDGEASMSVVAEHKGEPYSLQIDSVGDVLSLPVENFERNPITLDPRWQEVSSGIFRLDGELMVVLDVDRLLEFGVQAAA